MARFLVVAQWQGSSSSRAMQLIDGATAIAGDLPRAACTTVDVPMEAGESLDTGVRRMSALQQVARAQLEALAGLDETVVTVGGDAGVATTSALAAVGAARGEPDAGSVVVWFSSHAAMHDVSSAPDGAYAEMAARALVDDAAPRPSDIGIAPDRLILAGVRVIASAEAEAIERLGVGIVTADELTPDAIAAAIAERSASAVYIHVDLDVLDPAAISGVSDPEPFGPDAATLIACIAAARRSAPYLGGAITEFSPSSPAAAIDDLGVILRLVGALA
ncbi:MAG: arginase family protein [Microbacterium sp.]|nr:arginase family protein [Microbacterium sp.]